MISRIIKYWLCCGAILITLPVFAQVNISRIEYYLDSDPGYGNGSTVSFTGTNDVTTSFSVNLASLAQGVHIVGVRSRDANGAWSMDNRWLFLKPYSGTVSSPLPSISSVEYFVDTDPGYGNGIPVAYTGTSDISSFFSINVGALVAGPHIVGIRSKDANGAWSLDNKWLFLKPYSATGITPPPNLTKVEYYVDTDPGYGNGTGVAITPGQDISNLSFNVDFSSFSKGVHIIGVRSQDANGAWSIDNKWLFLKPYGGSIAAPAPNINKVEYYVDTDPGYGNGILLAVVPGQDLPGLGFTLDFSALTNGVHTIGVRSQDANGAWSVDNKWLFLKPYNNNGPAATRLITAMEYYLDFDPGYGKGKPVALTASNQLANLNIFANITGLTTGVHKLYFRSLDDQQAWSLNYVDSFTVNPGVPGPAINVSGISLKLKCAKDSIGVSFDATGTYFPGNQFNVEISDPNGVFPATPVVIGTVTSLKSDSIIKCTLLNHVSTNSNGYHVRVVSTNPVVTGASSTDSIAIFNHPLAQTITGVTQVDAPATLTYSVPNVATSSYNWFVTGGTKINGGNSNIADVFWPLVGSNYAGTIKIVEISQYGCPGDTSYLNAVVNSFCNQNLSAGGLPSIDSVSITYTPMSNVSGPPASPYTFYPPAAGTTATVYSGDRFELSVKVSNGGNTYNEGVWVDFNNNNLFESGENVILASRSSSVGSNWAQIPVILSAASVRLRIRVTTDAMTVNDYCKTFSNGETEDYTINLNPVLNCRWIGRVSTDWNNPGNWSCGVVPDSTKSVMIAAGTPFAPAIITNDVAIDRLWIVPSATLTVNSGRRINVNGSNVLKVW